MGETNSWYRARDPETNKIGYICKSYTEKLNKQVITDETTGGTQNLGKLTVNGEFELTCKIPEGYKLQVVDLRGESIIASVTSEDITKHASLHRLRRAVRQRGTDERSFAG